MNVMDRSIDKAEIRTALQNWQKVVLMNDHEANKPAFNLTPGNVWGRGSGDGKPSGICGIYLFIFYLFHVMTLSNETFVLGYGDVQGNLYKKSGGRRREPRRHTLQNGIDYNMVNCLIKNNTYSFFANVVLFVDKFVTQLKRIKQIEQEKDILMQGLTAVERTREWYMKQASIVQDKMKYLGRVGSHVVSSCC